MVGCIDEVELISVFWLLFGGLDGLVTWLGLFVGLKTCSSSLSPLPRVFRSSEAQRRRHRHLEQLPLEIELSNPFANHDFLSFNHSH